MSESSETAKGHHIPACDADQIINSIKLKTIHKSLSRRKKKGICCIGNRIAPNRHRNLKRFFKNLNAVQKAYLMAVGVAILVSLFVAGVIPNLINYISGINPQIIRQHSIYQPKDTERGLKIMMDRLLHLEEREKRRTLVQEY